ncbi:LacI family DNA-binding transcriptional regulator [Dictyobacter kobayashii]|uniref:LacI family transcriptional regulator n=1 Tax=Dictyobacter kobayashii TaxID=2014872 RepID=A0A402ATG7_9CHLR|nr:LacI family DNA-binding transcriptional regulator [Dictyobacter kobayashii]GCE22365.1 LacI family transcriptional regulator [Dictyobacter kobayashii]
MSDKRAKNQGGPSRALIWDIAQKSGVSIATVSRVLNERPDVSQATRDKVMAYVRELGYVSNRHARSLVSGHVSYIAFTVPRVDHFVEILEGATQVAEEHDANLVICPTRHEHSREVTLLERLRGGGADGALLILPSESKDELAKLRAQNYPFVVVDPRYPLGDEIPTVSAANMSGSRAATEHLVELGHKRIGVITGYPDWNASIDRLAGFHSVLIAAGLYNTYSAEMVCHGDFSVDGGYSAACRLLELADRPTAIFAFNDDMAVGAMRAIREHNLSIPEDISVVGFDDTRFASFVTPPLTTVRQPTYELGRVGIETLYRVLDEQSLEVPRIELSTKLIVRDSTAPCPTPR